jgi:hypothetical protein
MPGFQVFRILGFHPPSVRPSSRLMPEHAETSAVLAVISRQHLRGGENLKS